MAQAIRPERVTAADEIRDLLTRCEKRVVSPLEGGGVAELFAWMDAIVELWPGLEASGADLRAEQTRWESLQGQVRARASQLLRAWGGAEALIASRREVNPGKDRWWWWLDELVSQERRRRMFRALGVAVILFVVLGGGYLLFNRLFPVDPQVRALHRLQLEIESAIQGGDLQTARELLDEARLVAPDSPEVVLQLGAVAEAQGDQQTAQRAWDIARQLVDDEAGFLAARGQYYLAVRLPHKARQDEEAALALDPNLAVAHFLLGLAHEQEGDLQQAISHLQQASDLAQGDNPQLAVIARARMAELLQRVTLPTATTQAP